MLGIQTKCITIILGLYRFTQNTFLRSIGNTDRINGLFASSRNIQSMILNRGILVPHFIQPVRSFVRSIGITFPVGYHRTKIISRQAIH